VSDAILERNAPFDNESLIIHCRETGQDAIDCDEEAELAWVAPTRDRNLPHVIDNRTIKCLGRTIAHALGCLARIYECSLNRVQKPGALITCEVRTLDGGEEFGPRCKTSLDGFGNSSFDLVESAGRSCDVDQ
jgi:hypothetical protein